MGEETCLPAAEETAEPPLGAQRSGNYHGHGPPNIAGQTTQANTHDEHPPALKAAHTLTAAQVAQRLDVNI
jgi:hypothetical protein